jgi:hypothetical protein
MTLRACSQCRRHFAAEPACPFCGTPAAQPTPRPLLGGRFSRAAAFAGAALAGCYTSNTPPQSPPPSPPNDQQQEQHVEKFANPPPPVTSGSSIQGVLTDSASSQPLANWPVSVTSVDQPPTMQPRTAQTDVNGHYAFVDLPPGNYVVQFGYNNHPRRPAPTRNVLVKEHEVQTVDEQVYIPPPSNVPMPYGAPPVRRRVV